VLSNLVVRHAGNSQGIFRPGLGHTVIFHLPKGGGVIRPSLTNIRKMWVVTSYGSPWWLIRLVLRNPVRAVILGGLARLCGRGVKIRFLALYNVDSATPWNAISRDFDHLRHDDAATERGAASPHGKSAVGSLVLSARFGSPPTGSQESARILTEFAGWRRKLTGPNSPCGMQRCFAPRIMSWVGVSVSNMGCRCDRQGIADGAPPRTWIARSMKPIRKAVRA
jgi:hypothetical protein